MNFLRLALIISLMLSELQNKKKFPRDFSDFSEFLWLTRFYERFTIQKQVKILLTPQQGI